MEQNKTKCSQNGKKNPCVTFQMAQSKSYNLLFLSNTLTKKQKQASMTKVSVCIQAVNKGKYTSKYKEKILQVIFASLF